MIKQVLFLLFLTFSIPVFSQNYTPDLVTDRPDQTESATSLPVNYFQLETGTQLDIANGANDWTINTNLFRYGLFKNFELRVVTELHRTKVLDTGHTAMGIGDMELGLKYQFVNKKIEFAYLGHMILPTGNERFTANQFGVSNVLCLSHGITDRIDIGYNVGYTIFNKNEHGMTYACAVGFGLTEKIGFYSEFYGDSSAFDSFTVGYDNGFTYLIKPNIQLDFSIGMGITEKFNFYSLGLSWRLPK